MNIALRSWRHKGAPGLEVRVPAQLRTATCAGARLSAAGAGSVTATYVSSRTRRPRRLNSKTGEATYEESMHHVRVDVAERGVIEGLRQRRENREAQLLPEMDRAFVRALHEVELHRLIAGTSGLVQAMLAHGAANAASVR